VESSTSAIPHLHHPKINERDEVVLDDRIRLSAPVQDYFWVAGDTPTTQNGTGTARPIAKSRYSFRHNPLQSGAAIEFEKCRILPNQRE
jgi:hypothetical protein